MPETGQKSFFRAHTLLVFLPLLLMGAGLWYYIYGPALRQRTGPAGGEAFSSAASPRVRRGKAAAVLPQAYDHRTGIDIQGSPAFKKQVTHSLKLIWLADRETFLFINRSLYIIRNENKTGFYLDNGHPVAALSKKHAFRSPTWCAGIIAHQAWHAGYTLNKKKRATAAPPLPGEKDQRELDINPARYDYKGLAAILDIEGRASAFQLAVLRKTGAPKKETDPLSRRAARDFTYAHDGNYTLNP